MSVRLRSTSLECFRPWPAQRLLWWGYFIFVAGYFLLPQAPDHYRVYYVAVLLPVLWLARRSHRLLADNPLYWLVLAYVVYIAASALWSPTVTALGSIDMAWHALLVISFTLASGWLARTDQLRLWTLLEAVSVLAAAAGAVSAVVFYQHHPFPISRLEPLSRVNNPVLAGCTYGLFFLIAMNAAVRPTTHSRAIAFGCVALVLLAVVLMTQSRTALIALAAAAAMLAGLRSRWLLAIACGVIALFALVPGLWPLVDRGIPYRPEIWRSVIHGMDGHWLFGKGSLTPTAVTIGARSFPHAHSSYLATLRDGGLFGLALFAAMLVTALATAVRSYRERPQLLALLVFAFLCVTPDSDRLLSRPKEYWLFFWLPVLLLFALPGRRQQNHSATRSDCG